VQIYKCDGHLGQNYPKKTKKLEKTKKKLQKLPLSRIRRSFLEVEIGREVFEMAKKLL
jgi:hypothetical protein